MHDRLAELACISVGADVGLISVVTKDRHIFKATFGLGEPWASWGETPLSHSICLHTVEMNTMLVIDDMLNHPLVSAHPTIKDMGILSYIGHPIRDTNGQALGAVCALGYSARQWQQAHKKSLRLIAQMVDQEVLRNPALMTEMTGQRPS